MLNISHYLQREYGRRKDYVSAAKLEAFRLCNQTEVLPCAIDIYKDNAVVHLFDAVTPDEIAQIEEALKRDFSVTDVFFKDRSRLGLELPKSPHKEIVVTENGLDFLINLSDYQDTGLFLDHRETRRWVAERSKGKSMLNTFAYSGSFSIYAAKSGAAKTWSVDLSATYCDWIKKNLELNHLDAETNWVSKMDTMEFFRYATKKELKFDIIVIDPPTFSRNKGKSFSVQKDHQELINGALKLLAPRGFIMFSNNCREFMLNNYRIESTAIRPLDLIPPDYAGYPIHKSFIIENN